MKNQWLVSSEIDILYPTIASAVQEEWRHSALKLEKSAKEFFVNMDAGLMLRKGPDHSKFSTTKWEGQILPW